MSELEVPKTVARPPRLTIDLTSKAAKTLADAKPGLPIRLLVTGIVTDISLSAPDGEADYSGYMSVEVSSAKMTRDHQNAVADMFYEDNGPEEA